MFQNQRRNLAANTSEKQVELTLIGTVFPPTILSTDPRPTDFTFAQVNRMIDVRPVSPSLVMRCVMARLITTFGLLRAYCRLPRFVNAKNCPYHPNNGDQAEQFWK